MFHQWLLSFVYAVLRNTLIYNVLQNGPFRTAKWAVLGREMGRFVMRNGPFRKFIAPPSHVVLIIFSVLTKKCNTANSRRCF